jgi:hypothetical protein
MKDDVVNEIPVLKKTIKGMLGPKSTRKVSNYGLERICF